MIFGRQIAARITTSHLRYCRELATEEKALFAFEPTRRTVPTTSTKITASLDRLSKIGEGYTSGEFLSSKL
jgi:hypothetical protein